MRFITTKYGNRIGTLQAFNGLLNRLEQITAVQMTHKMGNHFGIRLAFKRKAHRL